MFIQGMMGLGDNVYQRAFISAIKFPVYIETPWPELYQGTLAQPVLPLTHLRTQVKNIKRQFQWHEPAGEQTITKVRYRMGNILDEMFKCLQLPRVALNLPSYGGSPIPQRYILVRPVTVRAEWRLTAESRNPDPQYVYQASVALKKAGYTIVSIADLEDGKEWALDPLPYADITLHKGELTVTELMRYAEHASGIVGGIGWIVPVCQAYRTPAFIICGGNGGYNCPENISDSKIRLEEHNIRFAVPDNFCRCTEKQHPCDKRIIRYEQLLNDWIAALGQQ